MEIGRAVRHPISGQDEKKSGSELKPGQVTWNALIEFHAENKYACEPKWNGPSGRHYSLTGSPPR